MRLNEIRLLGNGLTFHILTKALCSIPVTETSSLMASLSLRLRDFISYELIYLTTSQPVMAPYSKLFLFQ